MRKFTFIDLFAGIGGFRIAAVNNGGNPVGFSEIEKPAIETYESNFKCLPNENLGDITKITNPPKTDLVMGGVPCQSWSVAGKRRGFDDPRGKLWYDAIRFVEASKPKVFIFENVKGLADPRNSANLELILETLRGSGYTIKYKLLNSFDYGVPQNRTRIFIVGFRNDCVKFFEKFNFPKPIGVGDKTLADYLDGVEKKDKISKVIKDSHLLNVPKSGAGNPFQKEGHYNDFFVMCDTRNGHSTVHSWELIKTTKREKEIAMAILRNRRKKQYGNRDGNPLSVSNLESIIPKFKKEELDSLIDKKIIKESPDEPGKYILVNSKNSSGINGVYRIFLPSSPIFSTLTATGTNDYVATEYVYGDSPDDYKSNFIQNIIKGGKFRKITTDEARRIQGFPDTFSPDIRPVLAMKQLGNAVSPPVVDNLVKAICKTGVFDD